MMGSSALMRTKRDLMMGLVRYLGVKNVLNGSVPFTKK